MIENDRPEIFVIGDKRKYCYSVTIYYEVNLWYVCYICGDIYNCTLFFVVKMLWKQRWIIKIWFLDT